MSEKNSESLKSKIGLLAIGALVGSILGIFTSIYLAEFNSAMSVKREYIGQLMASASQVEKGNEENWKIESKNLKLALGRVVSFLPYEREVLYRMDSDISCISHGVMMNKVGDSKGEDYGQYIDKYCKEIKNMEIGLLYEKIDKIALRIEDNLTFISILLN